MGAAYTDNRLEKSLFQFRLVEECSKVIAE